MVLITGRWTKDLIPLLGLQQPPEIWGSHGWERLKLDGTYEIAKLDEHFLEGLVEADAWIEEMGLVNYCEQKPANLALHWRGSKPKRIKEIRNKVLENWSILSQQADLTVQEALPNCHLILGVDRVDYTKGIPERLKALRVALTRFPGLQQKVPLVQVVVPSRTDVPEYHDLKMEIERLVSEINGQFTQPGWIPIHYIFRGLERTEFLAYYRAANIALITPLKDGMNLVAKEYCAANIGAGGALVLSEFAGATAQLQKGVLLVNPYDVEGVAEAIYQAFTMSKGERQLRRSIRENDIFWWVDSFLQASIAQQLDDFPTLEDYLPWIEIE